MPPQDNHNSKSSGGGGSKISGTAIGIDLGKFNSFLKKKKKKKRKKRKRKLCGHDKTFTTPFSTSTPKKNTPFFAELPPPYCFL